MSIDEQIGALLAIAQEHTKQLAMIVQEHHSEIEQMTADVRRMSNGIQTHLELSGSHESRLNQLEGGEA